MPIVLKLTAKKGKPVRRGIDFFWSVIQGFAATGQEFTLQDIHSVSDADRSDIRDFLNRLEKARLIERTDLAVISARGVEAPAYRILLRQSATPKVRRDGTLIEGATKQQCMWNAMRSSVTRSGFTARDISAFALRGATKISMVTARSYIQMLARAGYLIQLDKGGPARMATWRLAPDKNTGPLPPMILRTKLVFDQNRHEIIGDAIAEEVRL